MGQVGKRLKEIGSSYDKSKVYKVGEAIAFLKSSSKVKFDETLEVAVNLGVDPQHSDQVVRGVVVLPKGTGKIVRVAVFAREGKAKEALDAGADLVGAEDLVENIEKNGASFDKCIATPDMMPILGKIAKILGPRGLMPNAKLGSVTVNVADAVSLAKSGQIGFRAEKNGIVHAGLGKLSFLDEDLLENFKHFVGGLITAKPAGAKGTYFRSATLSSTMGSGLKVDLSEFVS